MKPFNSFNGPTSPTNFDNVGKVKEALELEVLQQIRHLVQEYKAGGTVVSKSKPNLNSYSDLKNFLKLFKSHLPI